MKWVEGRQGTGYRRALLATGKRWDLYLIAYPPGTGIPEHVDLLPGRRHLRINLELLSGGSSLEATAELLRWGPLVVFWSDRLHRVLPGTRCRLVLSFGASLPHKAIL